MEKQKGGIFPIIETIEKEFGLEIHYLRDKHFVIFGPSQDVLDLMAQTLVLRYIMKVYIYHIQQGYNPKIIGGCVLRKLQIHAISS